MDMLGIRSVTTHVHDRPSRALCTTNPSALTHTLPKLHNRFSSTIFHTPRRFWGTSVWIKRFLVMVWMVFWPLLRAVWDMMYFRTDFSMLCTALRSIDDTMRTRIILTCECFEMFDFSRGSLYAISAVLLMAKVAYFGPMPTGIRCQCDLFCSFGVFRKRTFSTLTDGVA